MPHRIPSPPPPTLAAGPRTQVRVAERADYRRETIHSIFDEALLSHVGFVHDGRAVVIPMLHARIDDSLYIHGSPATRLFRALKQGPEVCITASVVDGLVLARSAFHHSANYRSAVVFGRPRPVADLERRKEVLDAYTDKIVPGRRAHLRPMTDKEIRGTAVLAVDISEASAKVRSGPPIDDDEDMELPIWSGVLPLVTGFGEPVDDPANHSGAALPDHVLGMIRR